MVIITFGYHDLKYTFNNNGSINKIETCVLFEDISSTPLCLEKKVDGSTDSLNEQKIKDYFGFDTSTWTLDDEWDNSKTYRLKYTEGWTYYKTCHEEDGHIYQCEYMDYRNEPRQGIFANVDVSAADYEPAEWVCYSHANNNRLVSFCTMSGA